MALHRVLCSRCIPAAVIAVGVALGCMSSPPPTAYERTGAAGRLDLRYSNKIDAATAPADPREIRILPLGLRPQSDGLYVDALIVGQSAERVATILNEHLRSSNILNGSVAIRRIAPEPRALNLTWDRGRPLLSGKEAIGYTYWDSNTRELPEHCTIVAIPLRSEPYFADGRYELRLLVPQDPAARIADLRDLKVIIDETPIMNDIRRIER